MTDERPETWQLLVLAYVDGELDPVSQLEVEAWIRTDPEVAELFRELSETGPENLARLAGTIPPKPVDVSLSGEIILSRLRVRKPQRNFAWVRPAVLSGIAASMAAVLYVACPPDHVCRVAEAPPVHAAPKAPADPLAEYGDLPIASPGEARVSAIRGDVSPTFLACEDLLPDLLDLASIEEVQIHKTGRSALSVPGPTDAPMIYQIQTRAK